MQPTASHKPDRASNGQISARQARRRLLLIVIIFLLIGIAYSIAVPVGESPDESEHFRYLQHIDLQRSLPIMSPIYEEKETLEAHQPPLYYLIGAGLTGWTDMDVADNLVPNSCFSFEPDDAGRQNAFLHRQEEWPPRRGVYLSFQLMRWISPLFGAGTVILAHIIGRQVVPSDHRVALAPLLYWPLILNSSSSPQV